MQPDSIKKIREKVSKEQRRVRNIGYHSVEQRHRQYLEDTAAHIIGSGGAHFVYRAQKDADQEMVEKADIILFGKC